MDWIIKVCLVVLAISSAIGMYRMIVGPHVVDRIIAFDSIVICSVAMIVLLSMLWQTDLFIEMILIVSALGFFGTVAYVYYLDRSERMKEDSEDDSI